MEDATNIMNEFLDRRSTQCYFYCMGGYAHIKIWVLRLINFKSDYSSFGVILAPGLGK